MSITPSERIERTLAIETLKVMLEETSRQLRTAHRRIEALEIQMRREGWEQEDLDAIEPSVVH
jgi:hypothetical protein